MLALVTNFFKGTLLINGSLSSNQLGGKGGKKTNKNNTDSQRIV